MHLYVTHFISILSYFVCLKECTKLPSVSDIRHCTENPTSNCVYIGFCLAMLKWWPAGNKHLFTAKIPRTNCVYVVIGYDKSRGQQAPKVIV